MATFLCFGAGIATLLAGGGGNKDLEFAAISSDLMSRAKVS